MLVRSRISDVLRSEAEQNMGGGSRKSRNQIYAVIGCN